LSGRVSAEINSVCSPGCSRTGGSVRRPGRTRRQKSRGCFAAARATGNRGVWCSSRPGGLTAPLGASYFGHAPERRDLWFSSPDPGKPDPSPLCEICGDPCGSGPLVFLCCPIRADPSPRLASGRPGAGAKNRRGFPSRAHGLPRTWFRCDGQKFPAGRGRAAAAPTPVAKLALENVERTPGVYLLRRSRDPHRPPWSPT